MIVLAETIVSLVFEGDLTRGRQGQPVSAAVDVAHDVTPALAVALVHSRFATTGMHAAAGGGLCLYERVGCARYDNVGVEAHYRFPWLVAIAGVHVLSFEGSDVGVKLAARFEHAIDRITLRAQPALIVPEQWWLPLHGVVRIAGPLHAGIETGLTAPLDEPSAWEVPLGVTVELAPRPVGAGLAFVWPRLVGGRDQPENRAPIHGFDHRVATLWITATW